MHVPLSSLDDAVDFLNFDSIFSGTLISMWKKVAHLHSINKLYNSSKIIVCQKYTRTQTHTHSRDRSFTALIHPCGHT